MAGNAVSVSLDHSLMDAALDQIGEMAHDLSRPAAQAGAQVFYDEVMANVGRIGKVTGNLASSIYQVYSKDNSTRERATYHVSWNASKAPHGHLVEYGHMQQFKVYVGSDGRWYTSKVPLPEPKHVGARPFIRPAYDSKSTAALEAAKVTWTEGMRDLIERLS